MNLRQIPFGAASEIFSHLLFEYLRHEIRQSSDHETEELIGYDWSLKTRDRVPKRYTAPHYEAEGVQMDLGFLCDFAEETFTQLQNGIRLEFNYELEHSIPIRNPMKRDLRIARENALIVNLYLPCIPCEKSEEYLREIVMLMHHAMQGHSDK